MSVVCVTLLKFSVIVNQWICMLFRMSMVLYFSLYVLKTRVAFVILSKISSEVLITSDQRCDHRNEKNARNNNYQNIRIFLNVFFNLSLKKKRNVEHMQTPPFGLSGFNLQCDQKKRKFPEVHVLVTSMIKSLCNISVLWHTIKVFQCSNVCQTGDVPRNLHAMNIRLDGQSEEESRYQA